MRGSTALLLAGAVAIVAGTTAPVLAADDAARVTPEPTAIVPGGPPPEDETKAESVEAVEAEPADAAGGLDRPSFEAEASDRSSEGGRDARSRERDPEQAKQPLADVSVTMRNIAFKPKTVTISPGDRVTWTNRDTAQHNAVDRGEFETRLLEEGESDSVTIDEAGTYNYICTVHPSMKGKLIAQTGGSGSSGGSSGSASLGGTGGTSSSDTGGSNSTLSSGSSHPSSAGSGSSGSLPNTGQEQLPLLILGAALIVAGLLTRAFHEYWIWR